MVESEVLVRLCTLTVPGPASLQNGAECADGAWGLAPQASGSCCLGSRNSCASCSPAGLHQRSLSPCWQLAALLNAAPDRDLHLRGPVQQWQLQQRQQQQRQRQQQWRGWRSGVPVTGRDSLQGGVRPDRGPCRPAAAALPEHPLLSHSVGPSVLPGARRRVPGRCWLQAISHAPCMAPGRTVLFLTWLFPERLVWVTRRLGWGQHNLDDPFLLQQLSQYPNRA